MKVAVVALPEAREPEAALQWLRGYLGAIGVEPSLVRANVSLEEVAAVIAEQDAVIVVGAAGNRKAVEVIGNALGLKLEVNKEALELVTGYYMDRVDIPGNVEELAITPEFSYVIPNERGPVPAFVAFSLTDDRFVAATPPGFEETIETFEAGIQDFFREKTGKKYSVTFSMDVECGVEEAESIVSEVNSGVKGVFARLDARFYTGKGLPLTFTAYSETPEGLSDTMERVEELVKKLAAEKGLRLVEKEKAGGVNEEDL